MNRAEYEFMEWLKNLAHANFFEEALDNNQHFKNQLKKLVQEHAEKRETQAAAEHAAQNEAPDFESVPEHQDSLDPLKAALEGKIQPMTAKDVKPAGTHKNTPLALNDNDGLTAALMRALKK